MSSIDASASGSTSDRKRAGAFSTENESLGPSPKSAKSADDNPDTYQKSRVDNGPEKSAETPLKKIAKVEICAGVHYWDKPTPASLLVHGRQREPQKFHSFAALDGCIIDEMIMWSRDKFVRDLVYELEQNDEISVHVDTLVIRKVTVWEREFKESMLRVRSLADALANVRRIVWTDFDWNHSYYLDKCRHADWFRDYRLPATVEIDGAGGADLIELLHHIHPNGGNSVTSACADTECGKHLETIYKLLKNDGAGSNFGSFKCTFSTTPAGRYGTELHKGVVLDFASTTKATLIDSDDGSIKFNLTEGNHDMHVVYEFKKNEDPNYALLYDSDEDVEPMSLQEVRRPKSPQEVRRRHEEALQKIRYGTLTINVHRRISVD